MFCSKCGRSIPEGSAFCTSCGSPLKQEGTAPVTPPNGPMPPYPNQGGYGAPLYGPSGKKKHTGLIIGIVAGAVLIAAAAVALFVWPGFLSRNDAGLLGCWYSEDRGEVIQFKSSGVRVYTADKTYKGDYEYDAAKARGVITVEDDEADFALTKQGLEVDGIGVYVKADDDFDTDDFLEKVKAAMAQQTDAPTSGETAQTLPSGPPVESAGAQTGDIIGLWYETTGYGGTLEFFSDGTYAMSLMGIVLNGTYDYDAVSGTGTLYEEYSQTEYPLAMSDGLLTMDSVQYTRDYVEQYDLSDLENAN